MRAAAPEFPGDLIAIPGALQALRFAVATHRLDRRRQVGASEVPSADLGGWERARKIVQKIPSDQKENSE